MRSLLTSLALGAALLGAVACGDGGADAEQPLVAVTTAVLGDVVSQLVGDQAEVVTIMPRGASPHDFQASARQVAELADADLVVTNGGGFEEGLLSVVEAAEDDGVPVVEALELVQADEDGQAGDAHFFTDPLLMAAAVEGLTDALVAEVPSLDEARLRESAATLGSSLEALHDELAGVLDAVPADRRVLVTDHDVFGAFADRFGFEVVATVIPSGADAEGVSGGALARLADTLRQAGVRAVFTEETASPTLAETLAAEVGGDVEVVPLHAETLGPEGSAAGTYAGMLRENAGRIAEALA